MKNILITGGTGTLGKAIVKQFIKNKIEPGVLSRKLPDDFPGESKIIEGDLTNAKSLPDALKAVNVVIHCASNPKDSDRVDVQGTQNLLDAMRLKNEPHLIYLSIAGVDQSTYPYYQNKYKVENMIRKSKLPWSILRVTQFHDFVLNRIIHPLDQESGSLIKIPEGLYFQSIDVGDVAQTILELVEQGPTESITNLGGPEILPLVEMTRAFLVETRSQKNIETAVVVNDFYQIFKSGINLCTNGLKGTVTWTNFLRSRTGMY